MNYSLMKQVLDLVEQFESGLSQATTVGSSIESFKRWVAVNYHGENADNAPDWEGKEKGRSADSVINTLITHMNRYAKSYSRAAILGSDFSSQEDFIYLISLKAFGEMSKTDLIKRNVHEKPVGIQVINRLITKGWVNQTPSKIDKRSTVLKITHKGIQALESRMGKIRQATSLVTGDLTHYEKMELIRLLTKLNDFHQPIYERNIEPEDLLNEALKDKRG